MTGRDEAATGGPLEGVVVVEIATVLAAPYAGHLLGLLGATVVKIEPPGGDPFRVWGVRGGEPLSPTGGEMFSWINAGKSSMVADFRSASDRRKVLDLVTRSDALVVSGRPGTLNRIGLDPEVCHAANSDLVIAGLTGFGTSGPLADRPAYDSVVQAVTGLMASYGVDARLVAKSLPTTSDMVGGLVLAQGVLAGLVAAARGRGGTFVETSLYEATCAVMGPTFLRAGRAGERLQKSLIFQLTCADERDVVVHLSTNEGFWVRLAEVAAPELAAEARFAGYADRVENFDALDEALAIRFRTRSAADWEEALVAADVPVAPVLGPLEARQHPQALASGMVDTDAAEGAERSNGSDPAIGAPWTFDGRRPRVHRPAPVLNDLATTGRQKYETPV